jgi:DNA-binding beta-propeller fold protein YncE
MPLAPVAPPHSVPISSGFDYVTVDAERRRVYAAHTGSRALLIVDADSGNVLGQVRVGPLHGVAVDPATGHVFTGDGEANTVSEIDPVTKTVLRSADVAGAVDAIAYDPGNGQIYADEGNGTRIFVVDAKTMKSIGTVALPGHKPEFLAVDPQTHDVYQNISDLSEFVIVDGSSLKVIKTIATPEIKGNHPLQYDPAYGHILVGGLKRCSTSRPRRPKSSRKDRPPAVRTRSPSIQKPETSGPFGRSRAATSFRTSEFSRKVSESGR